MEIMQVNLIAVAAATLVGMVLGALWYSPIAFGPAWMRAINKTPEQLGKATGPMIGSMVASLLTAIGVAIVFELIGVASIGVAVQIGLVLGLLIIFPALLSDNLFCGWGLRLLAIQAGYRVLSVLFMTVVVFLVG